MRVLIPTDAFPPVCGGSGWSTYELARGLRARGHDVLLVQPKPGSPAGIRHVSYAGVRVIEFGAAAPNVPYVRNYFKNERLYARLAEYLGELIADDRPDVVHAQHVLTSLPAIRAARAAGIPVVCTVRDYWPVCYWSDLIHTRDEAALCPECSTGNMLRCIQPRAGGLWPLAVPMIPYMQRNLLRKREGLAQADAVVAVSSTIGADLRARAPELAHTRVEVIPNPVDIAGLRERAAAARPSIDGPYALYLGKLAPNKGTGHLVAIAERAELDWPFVIVGDGPDRPALELAAKRSRRDVRFTGWVDQQAAGAWLAHASMLIFTSRGPESLSRVLIEASALGVPIAAMNTGGTPDIVAHGETGLLSNSVDELVRAVRRLRDDEGLRRRLGCGARRHVEARFDTRVVVARIEQLYTDLIIRSRVE